MRVLTISPNVLNSQSKNCWLYLQVRTTAFYFWKFWKKPDNRDNGWRIELLKPNQN